MKRKMCASGHHSLIQALLKLGFVPEARCNRVGHLHPPATETRRNTQTARRLRPLARRALMTARPDRVLWGTDFPHPNLKTPPDDFDLVDLVPRFAPSAAEQRLLLVENPARLYEFND